MEDTVFRLLALFEKIDSKKYWGINPDEAARLTLADAKSYLRSHTVEDYLQTVLLLLEGKAYQRKDVESQFGDEPDFQEELLIILKESEYGKMERQYTDLRQQTEIELADGKKITINKHNIAN